MALSRFVSTLAVRQLPLYVQPIKVAKPFTGSNRSVFQLREFLLSLNLKFGLNQTNDDFCKICILADNLGGKPTQWLLNYTADNDIHAIPYSTVVPALNASFGGQLDLYDISRKITSLSQRSNIDGYVKEF